MQSLRFLLLLSPALLQAQTADAAAADGYLVSTIRSFVDAVHMRSGSLFVSGHDLRQALEVAIACKLSAQLGSQPVSLPLKDRSLTLLPSSYRWLGGDASGNPQSVTDAAGEPR